MRSPRSIILVALVAVVGCGKGDSPQPDATAGSNPAQADAKQQMHPSAVAARQFLLESAKGNEAAAKALLTPLAAEQLDKSGQRLTCLGDDSAKFQITRWMVPQADEAAVEFRMQFSMEGTTEFIDGCCIMKNVSGSWRLAGVALDPGDGSEPLVVNYEQDLMPATGSTPAGTVENRTSATENPQTAQNPSSTQNR